MTNDAADFYQDRDDRSFDSRHHMGCFSLTDDSPPGHKFSVFPAESAAAAAPSTSRNSGSSDRPGGTKPGPVFKTLPTRDGIAMGIINPSANLPSKVDLHASTAPTSTYKNAAMPALPTNIRDIGIHDLIDGHVDVALMLTDANTNVRRNGVTGKWEALAPERAADGQPRRKSPRLHDQSLNPDVLNLVEGLADTFRGVDLSSNDDEIARIHDAALKVAAAKFESYVQEQSAFAFHTEINELMQSDVDDVTESVDQDHDDGYESKTCASPGSEFDALEMLATITPPTSPLPNFATFKPIAPGAPIKPAVPGMMGIAPIPFDLSIPSCGLNGPAVATAVGGGPTPGVSIPGYPNQTLSVYSGTGGPAGTLLGAATEGPGCAMEHTEVGLALAMRDTGNARHRILLDSGAKRHYVRRHYPHFRTLVRALPVGHAGGGALYAKTIGNIQHANNRRLDLKDSMHVEGISENLASIGMLCDTSGYDMVHTSNAVYAIPPQHYQGAIKIGERGSHTNMMYEVCDNTYAAPMQQHEALHTEGQQPRGSNDRRNPARIFHENSGHPSKARMKAILQLKLMQDPGYTMDDLEAWTGPCHGCNMGKATRLPFSGSHIDSTTGDDVFVYMDVFGPHKAPTLEGDKYFVCFMIRRSRMTYVSLLRRESEVAEAVEAFLNTFFNHFHHLPTKLMCDNATVHTSTLIKAILNRRGVGLRYTVPHCSEQNPAERYIREITSSARAMMQQAGKMEGRTMEMWGYAVKAASYVRNRMPCSANPRQASPYEMEFGATPKYNFYKWGSTVYSALPHDDRERARVNKLDAAAEMGYFVGYSGQSKGYLIFFPNRGQGGRGRVLVRRHVRIFPPGTAPPTEGDGAFRTRRLREMTTGVTPLLTATQPSGLDFHNPAISGSSADASGSNEKSSGSSATKIANADVHSQNSSNGNMAKEPTPAYPPHQLVNSGAGTQEYKQQRALQKEQDKRQTHKPQIGVIDKPNTADDDDDVDDDGPQEPLRQEDVWPQEDKDADPDTHPVGDGSNPVGASTKRRKPKASASLGDAVGIIIQQYNEKRKFTKSWHRYEKYKTARTVGQMLALGGTRADLNWDMQHGYTKLGAAPPDALTEQAMWINDPAQAPLETVFPDCTELQNMRVRDIQTPDNTKAANSSRWAHKWRAARRVEMQQMQDKGVLVPVDPEDIPRRVKPIPGRMVYAIKSTPEGFVSKFKGRFVGKGFFQRPGVDYDQTYAPCTSMTTLKMLISQAARKDMKLFQFDVEGAFLLPKIDKEVYIVDEDGNTYLCLRTLYGLKQSAFRWNEELDKELKRMGMKRSENDPCLYTKTTSEGTIMLVVWVDDVIGAATTVDMYKRFLDEFKFPKSTSEEFNYCLKIKVDRVDGMIGLQQTNAIEDLAHKYNILSTNPIRTPMETGAVLTKDQMPDEGSQEQKEMRNVPYRQLLGSLNYIAGISRGDIAGALSVLSRYAVNPGHAHWKALKRVLVYLYHSKDKRLVFGSNRTPTKQPIEIFVDADHAGCKDTAKSTTGIIVKMYGDTIFVKSKRQGKVSDSTTMAELHALQHGAKLQMHLRSLLMDLSRGYQKTIPIRTDSQCVVSQLERGFLTPATKHLRIAYHFVREKRERRQITVSHIPGTENTSDICTKALPRQTHEKHTNALMGDCGGSKGQMNFQERWKAKMERRRPNTEPESWVTVVRKSSSQDARVKGPQRLKPRPSARNEKMRYASQFVNGSSRRRNFHNRQGIANPPRCAR